MKKKISLLLGMLAIFGVGNYVFADVVSLMDPVYDAISYGFGPVVLIVIGLLAIVGISKFIIKKIENDSKENPNKKEGE